MQRPEIGPPLCIQCRGQVSVHRAISTACPARMSPNAVIGVTKHQPVPLGRFMTVDERNPLLRNALTVHFPHKHMVLLDTMDRTQKRWSANAALTGSTTVLSNSTMHRQHRIPPPSTDTRLSLLCALYRDDLHTTTRAGWGRRCSSQSHTLASDLRQVDEQVVLRRYHKRCRARKHSLCPLGRTPASRASLDACFLVSEVVSGPPHHLAEVRYPTMDRTRSPTTPSQETF